MSPTSLSSEFDLRPNPRILAMLGEINLDQWRCLAELIDNSIDGFLRAPRDLRDPTVYVTLPTIDRELGQVVVRDNGTGMTPDVLEQAVRAGWSSNSPIDSLGLFGMGFNIATARLGRVTTVWTTTRADSEWHGVRIDFDQLRRQGNFRTPRLSRVKVDEHESGTEVCIEQLKPEQRTYFSKPRNRTIIKKTLARTYSSMLRPDGTPIQFHLEYMGKRLKGIQHCVWGESRRVSHSQQGHVSPIQRIQRSLQERPYCLACWNWLQSIEAACPICGSAEVISRERTVRGWIGIQRYLDGSNFGIDFIRNGRKIELANKDLFVWNGDDGPEEEYPIDDQRHRGRIIGEIHIDHCRVSYSKERFDRTDPAWADMVMILRGVGPLRPRIARNLGSPTNTSPLYRLYQVFRRSSPQPRAAGWGSILVVQDNARAKHMVRQFNDGRPGYTEDDKWWALIEETDAELLTEDDDDEPESVEEFGTEGLAEVDSVDEGTNQARDAGEAGEIQPERNPMPSLSRDYVHNLSGHRWNVHAWRVREDDPELAHTSTPWVLQKRTDGPYNYFINSDHDVFRSATFTPLDALLAELASALVDFFRRDLPLGVTFGSVLTDLRDRYATVSRLDPMDLSGRAQLALGSIASSVSTQLQPEDARSLFNDLPESIQEEIRRGMVSRSVSDPDATISRGEFLQYASYLTLIEFFAEHPELFLDGRFWDEPYSSLDFGSASSTEQATKRVVRERINLLSDVTWLADSSPSELASALRARLLRAYLALELIEPDVAIDEE